MTSDLCEVFAASWTRGCSTIADPGVAVPAAHGTPSLALFFALDGWRPWLAQAQALLDVAERERVRRKHRPVDRDALALTYALHRLALGAALGRDAASISFARSDLGRPYLLDHALQTSLSHADGHAAVAIVGDGPVGIDLELAARATEMPAIATHVCHPIEARALAGLVEPRLGQSLLRLWVRKEALLKAAGIGLAREMSTLQAPPDRRLALPQISGADAAPQVTVRMLEVGARFVSAHASECDDAPHVAWLAPAT